jgi:hypothetical protein
VLYVKNVKISHSLKCLIRPVYRCACCSVFSWTLFNVKCYGNLVLSFRNSGLQAAVFCYPIWKESRTCCVSQMTE